jgi:hypothetical protein
MATIKLESFAPGTPGNTSTALFAAKLQNAVTTAASGTVIDCTSYTGIISLSNSITITRSVTLLFGNLRLNLNTPQRNMFNVFAPNVSIIGVSRSTSSTAGDGKTVFSMASSTSGSFHIYCANNQSSGTSSNWASYSGLTVENLDLLGIQSTYTSVAGVVNYTTRGVGGIVVAEGNPGQANTNVQNVFINNVFINGATAHGIMIYGGMTSKIQKCRVTNAGGHAYYIAGGSTSMNLDTCYALSSKLSGFCIHSSNYSSLNNCAADNCGVGYWLRSSGSISLIGCGAEASTIQSNVPNNLGLTLPSSAGNVTINDIGSDNVNYIKGISYFLSGGESNTLINPYSKDPGNRAGLSTYSSKYTAHLVMYGNTSFTNVISPKFTGTSPLKYNVRLEELSSNGPVQNIIQAAYVSFDPLNPVETADTDMLPVAEILDQGLMNLFGIAGQITSWDSVVCEIANPGGAFTTNTLNVSTDIIMPHFATPPNNPVLGSTYFDTSDDKIYVYNGTTWTGH